MKKASVTKEMIELLKRTADSNQNVSAQAMKDFTVAVTTPLREGIMAGAVLEGVYENIPLDANATPEFPLSPIAPGTEKDFTAFVKPSTGHIPERSAEADSVMVPIISFGNAVDWSLDVANNARWDIVGDIVKAYYAGIVKRLNDAAAHVALAAGLSRNIVVYDGDANAGQLTKRLFSLGKITMARNGGGNSNSLNRSRLTDMFLSPEGLADMLNWGVDQVSDEIRTRLHTDPEGNLKRLFDVNLHEMTELGEGQEYQKYYSDILGGSLASQDTELALGFDLVSRTSFVMPTRGTLETFEDLTLHRQGRAGIYGWLKAGFGCLDNRSVILLSY